MNTGAYLTHLLTQYEVECVFGIPGVHTIELYRALGESGIRTLTPRHEQSAGFMADGFARRSGKPGVCFIISGPGMTNIVTAMAQAWADSIPMLVVSTVNEHGRMGSGDGWLHELSDQQALVRGVCAFSHTLHTAHELPMVLARAFAVFDSSRPRPVHIEIPINVLTQDSPPIPHQPLMARVRRPAGNAIDIQAAAELINRSRAPLLLAGGGATRAHQAVMQLAELIDAPVVMTVNGRGIAPAQHPLAVGASASLDPVRKLITASDVVIAVGTELGSTDYDFNEDGGFAIPGQLIQIDIDPQQLMRTRIPDLAIVGDAQATLRALQPQLNPVDRNTSGHARATACLGDVAQHLSVRYTRYVGVLNMIHDALEPAPIIIGDSTQIIYAGNSAFSPLEPGKYFNSATGFGTLGYALPAAIGTAVATALHATDNESRQTIVAIAGDGGLQFTVGDLSTAIDAQVNLILIVHDNGGYVEIRQFMQDNAVEPIGVDLHTPDILMQATACGWNTHRLDALSDLASVISSSAQGPIPTLILIKDELFEY